MDNQKFYKEHKQHCPLRDDMGNGTAECEAKRYESRCADYWWDCPMMYWLDAMKEDVSDE